jgi:transcriptional regulator with GAF, ATPase, and Fis domain
METQSDVTAGPSVAMVRGLSTAVLIAMLSLSVVVARDVERVVGQPVPGFPVFSNGVVSLPMLAAERATPYLGDLRPQFRVVAIDGEPVTGGRAVWAAAARGGEGRVLRYTFERPDGNRFDRGIPVVLFTTRDFRNLYLPFVGVGLMLFAVGALPVMIRPDLLTARLLSGFLLGSAVAFGLLAYDHFIGYRFYGVVRAAGFFSFAALIHFGLVFPERRWPITAWPLAVPRVIYGATALLFLAHLVSFHTASHAGVVIDALQVGQLFLGYALLGANLVLTIRHSTDATRRQQALVVLPGPLLVVVGVLQFIASTWGVLPWHPAPAVQVMPILLQALLLAYAVLHENLFEFDQTVRRGLTIGIVGLSAIATHLVLFAILRPSLGVSTAWTSAGMSAFLVACLLPFIGPVRARVERFLEEMLFPEQRRARALIHDASIALAQRRTEGELVGFLRDTLATAMGCLSVRVLVGRPDEPLREIGTAAGEAPLVLSPVDPVYVSLRRGWTVNLDQRAPLSRSGPSRAATRQVETLGVRLVVPLAPSERMVGGVFLGPRRDGRFYTSDDEALTETLVRQAGAVIENAQAWTAMRSLHERLTAENVYLRETVDQQHEAGEMIGRSAGMRGVLALVKQIAPSDAAVLVLGETGSGKEMVVRALHAASRRRDQPLVKVACAAIPETLLESELFGYERGAFTGAVSRKLGRFEVADGGTIFFDDVDTLPLGVQAKLLRAVQEGELQRIGSNATHVVDVRVVAATNRDLRADVAAGRFREDLYYRLNVVPLAIPPLRDRPEDIPLLVEHFVRREGPRLGRVVEGIAAEALAEMQAYRWPGNVRELRNVVERALVMSRSTILRLPGPLTPVVAAPLAAQDDDLGRASLAELVGRVKVRLITRALELSGGNQRRAAELLGLHRPSLTRMLKELDLPLDSSSGRPG